MDPNTAKPSESLDNSTPRPLTETPQRPTVTISSSVPPPNPTPVPSSAPPAVANPVHGPVMDSSKLLFLIVGVFATLIILGGGYFLFQSVNGPVAVKEKIGIIQPVFSDYNATITQMIEHMQEDGGNDPESLERYAQRGKALLEEAKKSQEKLDSVIAKLSIPGMHSYKTTLEDYAYKAGEAVTLEEQNVAIAEEYVDPISRYQELTANLSGVSAIMFSDQKKYLATVSDGIIQENNIIKSLEAVNAKAEFSYAHSALIDTMKAEVAFLSTVKESVEKRDTNAIAAATQQYTLDQQENSRKLERGKSRLRTKLSDLKSELLQLAEKTKDSYNDLRLEYNI